MTNASEEQIGGDHYKDMAIQPFHYSEKNKLSAGESNVVKYISRWRLDGGKEDLQKAKHYVDLLLELYYPSATTETSITKTLSPSVIKKYNSDKS